MTDAATTSESTPARPFVLLVKQERLFLVLMAIGFTAVGFVYEDAFLARWLGFALAGYSAVANDSIQTIGTFIASNQKRPWWVLWLFIGGIFLATVTWSWVNHSGDVTFERLASKGFDVAPASFNYLQVAAPLVLLLLTRAKMPVSTSLLLLSCFTVSSGGLAKVLTKSVAGYGVAFVSAIVVFLGVSHIVKKWQDEGEAGPGWTVAQWITSGALWSVWVMQDAANIAVFLPRQLSLTEFLVFAGFIFLGLGLLFRLGGDRIQEVVLEKSSVTDVRAATVIDAVYAVILYIFKVQSNVPMSTTWVFVGLLAGREIAMTLRGATDQPMSVALKMMGRDLAKVTTGLVVSVALAMAANPVVADAILGTNTAGEAAESAAP